MLPVSYSTVSFGLHRLQACDSLPGFTGGCAPAGGGCVPADNSTHCFQNFNSSLCHDWTTCLDTASVGLGLIASALEFETQGPTPLSDRVCTPLTVCAAGTQYESVTPTPFADRACTNASVCNASAEYEQLPLALHADRVCAPLTECVAGEWEATAPSATSDRVCAAHRNCSGYEFETALPTETSDRQCENLTVCDAQLEYETVPPTLTSDRACAALTQCGGDGLEIVLSTPSSDRRCACGFGWFYGPPNVSNATIVPAPGNHCSNTSSGANCSNTSTPSNASSNTSDVEDWSGSGYGSGSWWLTPHEMDAAPRRYNGSINTTALPRWALNGSNHTVLIDWSAYLPFFDPLFNFSW